MTQKEAASEISVLLTLDEDATLRAIGDRVELLQELLRVARTQQAVTN